MLPLLRQYYTAIVGMVQTCSKIPSLAEQCQVSALLKAHNSGCAGPSGARSGEKEVSDEVVEEEADEKTGISRE